MMNQDLAVVSLADQFALQHKLSRQQPCVAWTIRADRLRRLQCLLRNHRLQIADAINADFGNRSRHETDMLEMFACFEAIAHALSHGKRWMRAQRRSTGFWFLPGRSKVLPQALGVIGIVVPWNYPLSLAVGPLVSALVAGNRAMIKLSEFTPCFAGLFAELVQENFAADEVLVINGDVKVAQDFCALPFDHLLFTGSTAVGHQVMRTASANLTPVTLELGGKSAAIIGPDADFANAVTRILAGKMVNAGQTCIAPDYVLLPAGQEQDFIALAREIVGKSYPELSETCKLAPDFTTIISSSHFARLQQLVRAATEAGATACPLSNAEPNPVRRLMPPIALVGTPDHAEIMQEEIFGPLLPLVGYTNLDEAISYVNARPRPLALYIFDRKQDTIDRLLSHTVAGGVTINDTLLHFAQEDLPFGGVGMSGMGAYHGRVGFETFSHMKPVFHQSRLNGMALLKPPYGKTFKFMLRLLLGIK
jgi:acyl-CoA reductase-like NAD-dependent aldehyde dehydrogenase